MNRRNAMILRVVLLSLAILSLGSEPACDPRPPTLTCDEISVLWQRRSITVLR